uniref:Amine oxidase domain-containing protein n=1 Tax=Euplotes crassus TaxID=5936 RepID=A0A7S3KL24_EUPCR|mmetsp:Transcript_29739/g.29321  ORF Transcript_29739/g.29321 Transcript_29739/m.29321 type:complete len:639 (+) Transcript_29739:6-1922(+)
MLKTILRPNMSKNYSIFGAGPSGLWTALRLSEGQAAASGSDADVPKQGDVINIYDPTRYSFSESKNAEYRNGDRVPGGRINTYYYGQKGDNGNWANFKNNTSAEMGGMRYLEYHYDENDHGHRLVTQLINNYDLKGDDFNTTPKPLKYIRGKHQWVGYDTEEGTYWKNAYQNIFDRHVQSYFEQYGIDSEDGRLTRNQRAKFYNDATYNFLGFDGREQVYADDTRLKNIGFWNLVVAEPNIGGVGYDYLLKTAGYNAFLINYNAASAMVRNNEFVPGSTTYHSIKGGFSILFDKMFKTIEENCEKNGIEFNYHTGKKVVSVYAKKTDDESSTKVGFLLGEHGNSWVPTSNEHIADHAFLCMPRHSLQQVASTTIDDANTGDKYYILNDDEVQLRLKSVISQPSFKIGAYFKEPWYENIRGNNDPNLKLDIIPHAQPGPTITDLPLRQTYYFGDNSLPGGEKRYAMLLSYDDMVNPYFWHQLRFTKDREVTGHGDDLGSHGCQYIDCENNPAYKRILRNLIAELHGCDISDIPDPCEAVVMDWSVEPFCGGYHAWEPHFDIVESQDKIRRPSGLLHKKEYRDYFQDAPIYIAGEAYSEDQGWVEGAFCTAESILADYLGVKPVKEGYYENYDLVLKKKE